MKTRIMILVSVAALLAVPVFAEFHEDMDKQKEQDQQKYQQKDQQMDQQLSQQMDQQKPKTVAEITAVEEGTEVNLKGSITEEQEENFYLFKDDTGELKLKISEDVWGDREVNPDKELEITGSAAKQPDTNELYIDVSEIEESGEMPEDAEQKRQEREQQPEDSGLF